MEIYTSYYGNMARLKQFSNNTFHAISCGVPKNITMNRISALQPDWSTVSAYKAGKIDWAEYTRQYCEKLNKLGKDRVVKLLQDGHVYFCYEGKGQNCHRHLLADWLREKAGIRVTEL